MTGKMKMNRIRTISGGWLLLPVILLAACGDAPRRETIERAVVNGRLAGEAFARSHRFVEGWLAVADTVTGLIPKNLQGDYFWNAQDAAADNYPFMVITSFFTDEGLFRGRMLDMLRTETELTSCLGACPATYDLRTHRLQNNPVDTGNVIFGSAEYMKDGLLPITELLGVSPWSERMISILDSLHGLVEIVTEIRGDYFGNSQVIEVNGDLLQVLSRLYWMTGREEYLEWAIRIGDYYLLGDRHPADSERLRLRDHGCEIMLGLCELYATVHYARPQKQEQYRGPLHRLLDRVLEVGRNGHGLFYDEVNPSTGEILETRLADTWGYTLDGYYIVYQLDGVEAYRDAVLKVFSNLNAHYRSHNWENNMDGYADAIESALNLYNRERSQEAADWIDSEINVMYSFQRPDGILEGWHGDGNFARTAVMYALWKTRGTRLAPWREDVQWGAADEEGKTVLVLTAGMPWRGKLFFDAPRYRENLHLPADWPRINQFPQWFTVERDREYALCVDGVRKHCRGEELIDGIDIVLESGQRAVVSVSACD